MYKIQSSSEFPTSQIVIRYVDFYATGRSNDMQHSITIVMLSARDSKILNEWLGHWTIVCTRKLERMENRGAWGLRDKRYSVMSSQPAWSESVRDSLRE